MSNIEGGGGGSEVPSDEGGGGISRSCFEKQKYNRIHQKLLPKSDKNNTETSTEVSCLRNSIHR